MTRRTPMLLLVCSLLLAGCTAPEPPGPGSPPGEEARVGPGDGAWIVRAGSAVALDTAAFGGEPPVVRALEVPASANEPTLGVDEDGVVFLTAARDTTVGVAGQGIAGAFTEILRSRDRGATWENVTPDTAGQGMPPVNFDPYVHVDAATGRVFSLDLYIGCLHLWWSDDQGETWESNPVACGVPMNDHQTLFTGPPSSGVVTVGYPSVVYLCSNQLYLSLTITCTRSLDGGRTFGPAVPVAVETEGDDRFDFPGGTCGGLGHGHGRSSPVDGTIYLPRVYCNEARVSVSRDSGLTWQEVIVDATEGSTPDPVDNHEGKVAVDAEGNVYYLWVAADSLPRVSVSTDAGATWSKPLLVAPPGLVETRFPALVAGDAGRVALLFYGTSGDGAWHAFLAFTGDGLSEAPLFAIVRANPHDDPLVRGPCREKCDGVGDFLDIALDPTTGRVLASLVDVCDAACAADPGSGTSAARGALAVQEAGFPLLAAMTSR